MSAKDTSASLTDPMATVRVSTASGLLHPGSLVAMSLCQSCQDSPPAGPSLDMVLVPLQECARFAQEGVVHLLRRQLARR
jgi:hypothetical protein